MDSELNPLKVILVLMECFVFGEQQQDFCVIDDPCVTIGFFTVIMFSSQVTGVINLLITTPSRIFCTALHCNGRNSLSRQMAR